MKRVFAICLICFLSSCASTTSKDPAKVAQARQNTSAYDEQYMARVEWQAQQRGVLIKWISPPKAPKSKKDGK